MIGHGQVPEKEKEFPKITVVYKALNDAGNELATVGKVRASTQKTANQNILPIPPVIRFLMKLKPIKRQIRVKILEKTV